MSPIPKILKKLKSNRQTIPTTELMSSLVTFFRKYQSATAITTAMPRVSMVSIITIYQ